MIKDLLLVVDDDAKDDRIVHAAIQFTRTHGCHLAVALVSIVPVPDFYMTVLPPFVTLDEYRARKDVKERSLREAAERAGVALDLRVISDVAQTLIDKAPAQTRYADLVVFGPEESWGDTWLRRRVLENVLLGSGRPVLLVPEGGTVPSFDRAVVGWNASAEATRAVHAVMPHLTSDARLVVATVNAEPSDQGHGSEPGADLATHLARYGFDVEVRTAMAPHGDESQALSHLAEEAGCDLLVLGAFARSRLRELAFGGVTEDMIGRVATPTLLMH